MKSRHPSRVIAGAAILALVISFVAPFPVLADETPPPAEPTAEATPAPAEEVMVVEGDAADPAAIEAPLAAPADENLPAPEALVAPEQVAADSAMAELIEAAPDGTTIAVVDASGELLPLASEEAAEVIAGGDPVWCPASVKAPTPGLNGCSPGFYSADGMSDLIDYLSNDATEPAMDGIIWIEAGDHYDTLPIVLDGVVGGDIGFTTMSNYKLTLRGGWYPITNKVIPGETSNFSVQLIIRNWHADVTLSDIVIEGASTAAGADALEVNTTGNISLQRVRSESNDGNGARLVNSGGTGTVTVTDSQFLDNDGGWGGLYVESLGSITLSRVIAEGNSNGYGAYLFNANAPTPKPVALGALSAFNDNGDHGVYVYTFGAITDADLTDRDHDGWGAQLHNYGAPNAQPITLTGTNIFTENGTGGLDLASIGAIKLNSVIADSNGGLGAQLLNTGAASDQPITLTGTSTFKYNGLSGLYIASRGPVTLNNITASGSAAGIGLDISTTSSPGAGVTVTGTNTFNDNFNHGVRIFSYGLIKLNNLTALENGWGSGTGYGVSLVNNSSSASPGVTLSGTNNLSGNRYQGLYLYSKGPVAISNLTASSNNSVGAEINNSSGTSPQKVTLTGKNVFSDNASIGLELVSLGAISASNLTASGNGTGGSGTNGVYLYNAGGSAVGGVTLTGVNLFTGNGRSGLYITSLGAIKISSMTASGNGAAGVSGNGAYLSNNGAAKPGAGVTLSGSSLLNDNLQAGMFVYSRGPISLASLTACGNDGVGVQAGNGDSGPASPQKITLSGTSTFNDNGQSGLDLGGYGAITLSSLTASGNGDYGVTIYNAGGDSAQPVTLSGSYNLHANSSTGLYVASYGLIKVNNVSATDNGGAAAVTLGNSYADRNAGITLSGQNNISDNEWTGLGLYSSGPITVSSLTANGNGTAGSGSGAEVSNDGAATAQKVTFSGTSTFHGNATSGLHLSAAGAISLSNVSGNDSVSGDGVYLDNNNGFTAPVTLSGSSAFNDNDSRGLYIWSIGAISLNTTRLEANHNGSYGIYLVNSGAGTPQKVTLKGQTLLSGNHNNNLNVESLGAISVSNLTATGSVVGNGATLTNSNTDAAGGVTLSGTNRLDGNAYTGLSVSSFGAVSLNNLTATGNGVSGPAGDGVHVSNLNPSLAAQPGKLTGVNCLSGNYGVGLRVWSNGAIAINSLTASDNAHSYGAYLSNEGAGSVGGITFTGTNVLNGNWTSGLEANSLGAISANNLTASGNGGYGTVLANFNALTPQAVKLTGTNTFTHNGQTGLDVSTDGAITINNLTASHNGLSGWGYGANLLNYDGDPGTPAQGVTLTGTNTFAENDGEGLFISSDGVVALTKIYADGNGGSGLYVANNAGGVTVTCGTFVDNASYGVYAFTSGVLKLVGVVAVSNSSLAGNIHLAGGGSLSLVRACPLG